MKELRLKNSRLDGRYDIIDCLGRGSYSEIYRAHVVNPSSVGGEPEVVIKALNVFLQGTPEPDLERTLIENFQNEALALDRVRHPHIIRRLGHGTALDMTGQPFHYLVLEYLPGGDLYTLCRATPFRLNNALYYLEQVCAGLAHAHACGVIHRDIKPQNILLTANRRSAKIADFGVAKLNVADDQITRVGTNAYAPPEHSPTAAASVDDEKQPRRLTPAADIYSLAKTLYTLLAGEPPRRAAQRPIESLPANLMAQSWGPALLRVLRRATQSDPTARYQDVRVFWEEIADAAIKSTPATAQGRTAGTVSNPKISRELSHAAVAGLGVPEAPPRPRFESATALREETVPQRGEMLNSRAQVVVPVAPPPVPPVVPVTPAEPDVIERLPPDDRPVGLAPRRGLSRRALLRLGLGFLLVGVFLSMLLATNYYVKNYWNRNANSTPTVPTPKPTPKPPTKPTPTPTPRAEGEEGTAKVDVNLRDAANAKGKVLGIIGKGSRVRVIRSNGGWSYVQVVEYVAPLGPPVPSAQEGWVNTRNITF